MSSAILKRIADLARPVTPPAAWSFLAPVPSVRQLSMDSSGLIEALQREFTTDQLEAARVLVRQQDNSLGPTSVFVGELVQGLFLRRKKDEAPFDSVNRHGSLATDDPPAFGACRDFLTVMASGQKKLILTTCSDDDLAVLRMLGMPCTPAAGLAQLTGREVRSLCDPPRSAKTATATQLDIAAVTSSRYQLILVGLRLAKVDKQEPQGLNAVISRVVKAEDAYGLDTSERVRVWQPTASELSCISAAVDFADRGLIRNAVWQSAGDSNYSVREYCEMKWA